MFKSRLHLRIALISLALILLFMTGCNNGNSETTPTHSPSVETPPTDTQDNKYAPSKIVLFKEFSEKMAEFGLKKFPRGVFQQSYPEQTLTEDPDPLKDFMNTISYVGSLHVYATQEGGTPAYLPDHEVSYVTVFLVFNGLDIDSNGEPVMDQDSLYVPAEQKGQVLEYGSSTIDKFWKVLEFWTEMRFNQSIGELRSIVGKGSIASRNGDGVYDEELDINNVWKTEKYPYGIISVVRVDQQFGVVVVRL